MSDVVRVRLLAGRTGVGRAGDVVEYSRGDAERYVSLGVAQYVVDAVQVEAAPDATPAPPSPPVDESPDDPGEAPTDGDMDADDENPYEKRPLKRRRRR